MRHIAWKKTQALARFYCRAHENYAPNAFALERIDCTRNRKIGFSGSSRANTKCQVMFVDTFQIRSLIYTAWTYQFFWCLNRNVFYASHIGIGRHRRGLTIIHHGLLQKHVHTLSINTFAIGHLEQKLQHIATHLRSARLTRNAKTVTATRDFYIETAFNMAKVFIELAAQISQAVVIGGLEDNVSRYLDSIQST